MSRVLGEPKGKGAPFSKRKLEVLKAAAKLFNERGFHSATMDDIAAVLNVTKPALYYYASSKDELLFEVGSMALRETTKVLDSISLQEHSPVESLQRFFISWTESICKEFGRCLVLTKPELLEPASRKTSKLSRRKIHQQVTAIVQSGIDDGSIKECSAELMSLALFDLFNGITYWYKPTGPKTPTEIAEEYWRNFGAGFLNDAQ